MPRLLCVLTLMIRCPGSSWASARPIAPDGWTTVTVKAAALNHHDVWSIRRRGDSRQPRLPIVLGCDAAGLDEDGNEVVVHAVIADPDAGGGDETLDPRRSLLSSVTTAPSPSGSAYRAATWCRSPAALSFEETGVPADGPT